MRNKKLNADEIIRTLKENKGILEKYGVKKIGLFGSFVRGEEQKNSDIDFVVEFDLNSFGPEFKGLYNAYIKLCDYLERLFGRKIEILTPEGVDSIRIEEIKEGIRRSVTYV